MLKNLIFITLAIILSVIVLETPYHAVGQANPTINDYYSPCRGGSQAYVTTWHGINQDGRPPYDPTRRTYDFRCADKMIYAPHNGIVWGVTPRFGGLILVDDLTNEACMIFLGMHGIDVEPNQIIKTGDLLGFYGHAFHLTAVDGHCFDVNWYDASARDRERPVAWLEFGEVIQPDIPKTDPLYFSSQNPGGYTISVQGYVKQIVGKWLD